MSQTPDNEGDFGQSDLDPNEQADAQRFLDDPSAGDDEPWSPPDRLPRGAELIGVETDGGETLDQRLHQEVPDGEEPEAEPMLGGDDPDAIRADDDVLGGPADDDIDDPAGGVRRGGSPEEQALHLED